MLNTQDLLPTLTPNLLEPLNRSEEPAVLPALRLLAPLKFSSNSPLSSWTRLRTDRQWGRPRSGPPVTKGGSEESGSSSSSIDLEDEGSGERDVIGKASRESPLRFSGDGSSQLSIDKRLSGDDSVRPMIRNIPLIHRSANSGKHAHRKIFGRSTDKPGETVTESEEVKSNAGQTPEREISHETEGEPDERCEGHLRCDLLIKQDFQVGNSISHRADVKLQTDDKVPSPTMPGDLSESDLKVREGSGSLVGPEERRRQTKCSQRSNTQGNQQPFNSQACHNHSKLHCNKSKSIMRFSSSESKQNKDKKSKSPGVHCEFSSPPLRKKASDKSRRSNFMIGSNRAQQLPALRELKDTQLLKRPSLATRSKSAVDFITYNDMFQQIQNGDEGPAIYEMFAGPLYDNLRASSSCDHVQDRKVQSAKATCRPLKHARVRKSQVGPAERTAGSAKERPKPGSSRQKNKVPSAPSDKNQKIESVAKHHEREEAEPALPEDANRWPAQEKGEDQMLSTIEESCTSQSGTRTLNVAADYSPHTPLPPDPSFHQNPEGPRSDTGEATDDGGPAVSPVYRRFLDDVGDGPLTDELLQCLAEELISLDERDAVSTGPCESLEASQEKPDAGNDPACGKKELHHVKVP